MRRSANANYEKNANKYEYGIITPPNSPPRTNCQKSVSYKKWREASHTNCGSSYHCVYMLDIISDLELSPKCHDVLLGFFDSFAALLFLFLRPYVYVDAQSTPSWQTTTVFHNHFYDKKTFNKQKFNKVTDLASQIWGHWCWYRNLSFSQ